MQDWAIITIKNGAKLGTNFPWKKDAELDKSRPWKIGANLGESGAKLDSSLLGVEIETNLLI